MSLILRIVRKSRWLSPLWLSKDDVQADSITDLSTKDNELSVWFVRDDKANLKRIISALAANRTSLSNFDYVLFNKDILIENKIKMGETKGISKDDEVNKTWHLDLFELTAQQIVNLAKCIKSNGKINRIFDKDVKQYIIKSIEDGNIEITKLDEDLRKKIEK